MCWRCAFLIRISASLWRDWIPPCGGTLPDESIHSIHNGRLIHRRERLNSVLYRPESWLPSGLYRCRAPFSDTPSIERPPGWHGGNLDNKELAPAPRCIYRSTFEGIDPMETATLCRGWRSHPDGLRRRYGEPSRYFVRKETTPMASSGDTDSFHHDGLHPDRMSG